MPGPGDEIACETPVAEWANQFNHKASDHVVRGWLASEFGGAPTARQADKLASGNDTGQCS